MSKTEEKTIQLPYSLSVRELAGLLNTSAVTVIKILMSNGVMASINQQIDFDTAAVVATELGYEPQLEQEEVVVEEISVVSEVEADEEKPIIRSVNDIIKAPPAKLDVKRSLSLNDRFYYQRELFDNDREAMNSMMLRLNAFDNYADTERYLRENTSWDFKDERVKSFLELLKKGFE